jgi:hypothetical protein
MPKFIISLSNHAGEIDVREATDQAGIRFELIHLAGETVFADGDVIRIFEKDNAPGNK